MHLARKSIGRFLNRSSYGSTSYQDLLTSYAIQAYFCLTVLDYVHDVEGIQFREFDDNTAPLNSSSCKSCDALAEFYLDHEIRSLPLPLSLTCCIAYINFHYQLQHHDLWSHFV